MVPPPRGDGVLRISTTAVTILRVSICESSELTLDAFPGMLRSAVTRAAVTSF